MVLYTGKSGQEEEKEEEEEKKKQIFCNYLFTLSQLVS
jgi:hypothetical protein